MARVAVGAAVRHERDLPVPMSDGAVLAADRWSPPGLARGPVVLVRSPYGRRGAWGALYGRPLAAAGWSVVIASVRGTTGPGDRFDEPMVREAADGVDTVAWLRRQRWWDGRLATVGMSYLGYTQWAMALDPPPELAAMVVQVGPHEMERVNWPGGAFALSDSLGWAQLVGGPWRQPGAAAARGALGRRRALADAVAGRPTGASTTATGAPVEWWEGWAAHGPGEPWWGAYDCSAALDEVSCPVLLQGGWLDVFRRAVIHQHATLTARGVPTGLTVGPWTHTGMVAAWPRLLAEAVAWLSDAFARRTPAEAGRVRTAVLGGSWTDWPAWPPPSEPVEWHLGSGGRLLTSPAAAPDASLPFDPGDPTPHAGGDLLGPGAGRRGQAAVEARGDVATFTSPPAAGPGWTFAGPVSARLVVGAPEAHQVVVRLCDVGPSGRSVNLCEGITARPAGDPSPVGVDLGPIAARIAPGHRLRLQVAPAASPRYAPPTARHLLRVGGGSVTLPATG